MKKLFALLVVLQCLGTLALAQATGAMITPPKVMVIIREVEKPGKTAAHEKWETGWPRAFAKANWPMHYIGASSLTGEPRALFFEPYESMAAWEKDSKAMDKNSTLSAANEALAAKDGEYISEIRTVVCTYMPELSYHPEVPVKGTQVFMVYSIAVKPGHEDQFEDARKAFVAAHQKANLPDHFSVYHIVAGSPGGHYLLFLLMQSLSEEDDFATVHGKGYHDALGEEGQKKMADLANQGTDSTEAQLFRFNPKMSYPSKAWVDADPEFWSAKPAAIAKPMAKKDAEKK